MIPAISRFMTRFPKVIQHDSRLREAETLMEAEHIRHLPVLNGKDLVGILSYRDVEIGMAMDPSGVIPIGILMTPSPYSIGLETPTDQVLEAMAAHKYGCAIVVDRNGNPTGIFTSTDAVMLLARLLRDDNQKIDLSKCLWPT